MMANLVCHFQMLHAQNFLVGAMVVQTAEDDPTPYLKYGKVFDTETRFSKIFMSILDQNGVLRLVQQSEVCNS